MRLGTMVAVIEPTLHRMAPNPLGVRQGLDFKATLQIQLKTTITRNRMRKINN